MELYRDELVRVERREGEPFVRMVRSARALETVAELQASADAFQLALPLRERGGLGILTDMRAAPLATNPELERAMMPVLQQYFRGFERRAILLATAVGQLQATRTSSSSAAAETRVFRDESAAVEWLRAS